MTGHNFFDVIVSPQKVLTKGINSICFENQGEATAIINNALKVAPGTSKSISQVDPRIIDETDYEVKFTGNGTREVVVITTKINQ